MHFITTATAIAAAALAFSAVGGESAIYRTGFSIKAGKRSFFIK